MPSYKIVGIKETKGGTQMTISEHSPSRTKAEWLAATYRAEGYEVTITEEKPKEL